MRPSSEVFVTAIVRLQKVNIVFFGQEPHSSICVSGLLIYSSLGEH